MILVSSIVKPYYAKNVGFYILILFVGFGIIRGQEHVQLCKLIMSQWDLLLAVVGIFALHVLKTQLFVHRILQEPTHQFLQDFEFLPVRNQLQYLIIQQMGLNGPFLAYSILMGTVALQLGRLTEFGVLLFALVLLITIPVELTRRRMLSFVQAKRLASVTKVEFKWPQTEKLWFIRYLVNKEPILLLSLKLFSILLIIGMASLYPTDDYDFRLVLLAAFFSGIGHFTIGNPFRNYLAQDYLFGRNIPQSQWQGTSKLAFLAFFITLIDGFFIYRYLPEEVNWMVAVGAWFMVFSFCFFWLNATFWRFTKTEAFTKWAFLAGAVFLVLIMGKVHWIILCSLLISSGILLYYLCYNTFEEG